LARISLTIPAGVTDLPGVPLLLLLLLVGLPKDELSNMARVAANVGSFFTLPTESLSAEPASRYNRQHRPQ